MAPVQRDIVEGTRRMICVRVNPNARNLKGRFAAGSDMVRFHDALGREIDGAPSTDRAALAKKIEEVAGLFKPKRIPWEADYAKAVETARLTKQRIVLLGWDGSLDEEKRWKKFAAAEVPEHYLGDFLFVKAASGLAAPGTILVLDASLEKFEEKPLEKKTGPLKGKEFFALLLRAGLRPSK